MADLGTIFQQKYDEFSVDLEGTLPELKVAIVNAKALGAEERAKKFAAQVLPNCSPNRDKTKNPGLVLPGVTITDSLWTALSDTSQKAIQEYLTLLGFTALYSGAAGTDSKPSTEWTESFLNTMREKMSSMDFDGISKKIADMMSGLGPDAMPKIPERFLKGHLAKLVEELSREVRPEDLGLTKEQIAEYEKNPGGAFELITQLYTKNPEVIQNLIKRVAKRIQDKIQRGEIRPDQIAVEAEEMMKEFTGNGAFMEMMSSFKDTFGMADPDLARAAGREGDARRNLVKERLRKKLAARNAGKK